MIKTNRKIAVCILIILSLLIFITSCERYDADNLILSQVISNYVRTRGAIAQDGNYIYLSRFEENNYARLYKTDLNGKNKVMLLEYMTTGMYGTEIFFSSDGMHFPGDLIRDIHIVDNWIYYIGAQNMIYRVDKTGENNKIIKKIEAEGLTIHMGKLYVTGSYNTMSGIFVMDYNGENLRLLYDCDIGTVDFFDVRTLRFFNDYIFFRKDSSLFRIDLYGNNLYEVHNSSYPIYDFYIYNDNIYYISNSTLYKMDIDGRNLVEICDEIRIFGWALYFYENNLFYLSLETGFFGNTRLVFNQVDLDSGEIINKRTLRQHHNPNSIYVIDNRILFDSITGLYSMDFDGSNLKRFGS